MGNPTSGEYVTGWGGAQLHVGMAFGSEPFSSSASNFDDRTFVPVSTLLRQMSVFRGRTHDLDEFGPGTLRMVLDNRTRTVDPACTSGSYTDQVIPGVPVRVWMKPPGGTTGVRMWSGFTESYMVDYPGLVDSRVTVGAHDGMKYLQLKAISSATTRDTIQNMINNVLTGAEWPDSTGWRAISTSISSGSYWRARGAPALEVIRGLADAEGGVFFMGVQTKARFENRRFWVKESTNKAIFGDANDELPCIDMRVVCDDSQLYNKAFVTGLRGVEQSTKSNASISKYGRRDLIRTNVPVASSTASKKIARWLVERYKNPGVRIDQVTCMPQASTGLFDTYDKVGIGNRVTVRRRPPGGGLIAQVSHVEGIQTDIDVQQNDWRVRFYLTPQSLIPSSSF
jgi:hypothetical protein